MKLFPFLTRKQSRQDIEVVDPKKLGEQVPTASPSQKTLVGNIVGSTVIEPVAYDFYSKHAWKSFRKMRRDPIVSSALELKTFIATQAGWTLEPASEEEKDKEIALFIEEALGNLGIYSVIKKTLDAVAIGFSVQEKIWETTKDGKLVIAKTKAVDPQFVTFEVDDYWNVVAIQITTYGTTYKQSFPREKFIYCVYNPMYEHPYGHGDLLEAFRAWWLKDEAYKWWAIHAERHARGTEVFQYDKEASDVQTKLEEITKSTGARVSVLLPKTIEYKLLESVNDGTIFDKFIQNLNGEIATAILGATLATSEGRRVGSKAMASVHLESIYHIALSIARMLEEDIIGKQIIQPMVKANYLGVEKFPKFKFNLADAEEYYARAEVLFKAIDRGILDTTEPFVRSTLGFPQIDEESEESETKSERQLERQLEEQLEKIRNGEITV